MRDTRTRMGVGVGFARGRGLMSHRGSYCLAVLTLAAIALAPVARAEGADEPKVAVHPARPPVNPPAPPHPTSGAPAAVDKTAKLPPAATRQIDFTKDIKPLFEASCIQCHAKGKTKGGLSLQSREAF